MDKVAIIGAGISGLTIGQLLLDKYDVTIFEKEDTPGGLIRCKRVNGSLFHICGGHVFNSKRQDVLDWFWGRFDRDSDFTKALRNSSVFLDDKSVFHQYKVVPYPIENHVYLLNEKIQSDFYEDLAEIDAKKGKNTALTDYANFSDFLRWRFGKTLFSLYFGPYNRKVWRQDLSSVPMSWMKGKLPMPTTDEMRTNNANRIEEREFVHSSFWYEKNNGSQFIADNLAEGLNIKYNSNIRSIERNGEKWAILGESFDKVVFCGNVKDLPNIVNGLDISFFKKQIDGLKYHGTTSVFCEIDANPYSWIYLPSERYESHRIICTGNFATDNNANLSDGRISATVEFTDEITKDEILDNLNKIPLRPKYLDHQYNRFSYPIQDTDTREMIFHLKALLADNSFFLSGRFADWEYYNMDAAIGAAMDLCNSL